MGADPPDEGPVSAAERIGELYLSRRSAEERKDAGQYFTPAIVARYMGQLVADSVQGDHIHLLDPGAGSGILSCAAIEALVARPAKPKRIDMVAYESDPELARVLNEALAATAVWANHRRVDLAFTVSSDDFVLAHAPAVDATIATGREGQFDAVTLKPPYFKVSKADPRARAASKLVHGQPNIYGLFMAISAAMLKRDGRFVSITPRSFASRPYFRLFRERFFSWIKPTRIHLFDSRKDAFQKDKILQENVIFDGFRCDDWLRRTPLDDVTISASAGVSGLASRRERTVPLSRVLDTRHGDFVLRILVDEEQERVVDLVDSWPERLSSLGLAISTGPVVPFRTAQIAKSGGPPSHAPLLWMQHVRTMSVDWPVSLRKGEFIAVNKKSLPLLVPNKTYVLMRRFSAKEEHRRLVVAPLIGKTMPGEHLGLENHLNYIHRPSGAFTPEEATGLAALLGSSIMDAYFRISNGNTQVSARELRTMPLPSREALVSLGRRVIAAGAGLDAAERLTTEVLSPAATVGTGEAVHAY